MAPCERCGCVAIGPGAHPASSTYHDPRQHLVGIEQVVVNGRIAVRDGQCTGVMAGRVV
ncbi:MAG: hypothetical protein WEB13_02700 [Dehalococcoidia bacterium]